MIQKYISKLPLKAKKLYVLAFNKLGSHKLALDIVRQQYKYAKGNWYIKKSIPIKSILKKSGFFTPTYYLDIPITSTKVDKDNHRVSSSLLEKLVRYRLIDEYGDIDHLSLESGIDTFNGLFKLSDYRLDDDKLMARLILNKEHDNYKSFIKSGLINKITGVSAEFYDGVLTNDNEIIDCDRLGWTVTIDTEPINYDAII